MFTMSLFIIIIIHVGWMMNVLRIYYTIEHCYKLEQVIETLNYVWMCIQCRNSTSNVL